MIIHQLYIWDNDGWIAVAKRISMAGNPNSDGSPAMDNAANAAAA